MGLFGTGRLFLGQALRGWLLIAIALGLVAWIVERSGSARSEV